MMTKMRIIPLLIAAAITAADEVLEKDVARKRALCSVRNRES